MLLGNKMNFVSRQNENRRVTNGNLRRQRGFFLLDYHFVAVWNGFVAVKNHFAALRYHFVEMQNSFGDNQKLTFLKKVSFYRLKRWVEPSYFSSPLLSLFFI